MVKRYLKSIKKNRKTIKKNRKTRKYKKRTKKQKGGNKVKPVSLVDVGVMNNCWNSKTKKPIDDYYYRISIDETNREEAIRCILNKYSKESIFIDQINNKKITNNEMEALKNGLYTYIIAKFEDGNDYMVLSPVLSTLEINAKHACLPMLLKNKYSSKKLLKNQENMRYYDIDIYAAGNILKENNTILMDFYSGTFFKEIIDIYKYEGMDLKSEGKQREYFDMIKNQFFEIKQPLNMIFSYTSLTVPELTLEHLKHVASCGYNVYRSKNSRALTNSYDFIVKQAEKGKEKYITYLKEIENVTDEFSNSAIV